MLQSAVQLLDQYIEISHWFSFRRFELVDIEVEERGYLCLVNDRWLLVYETDFLILDLPKVLDEISYVFEDYKFSPRHWLAKKNYQSPTNTLPLTTSVENDKQLYNALIYRDEGTHKVYAVLELDQTPQSTQL